MPQDHQAATGSDGAQPGFPDFLSGGGELGALMRAKDWSKTSLGPASAWPQSLRTCLRIVLTSRQPMFVWWGDELINLYNDAYKAIVGGKHPVALGQPASVVWREIWDQVGPRAASAMRRNEGTYDEALLLIMERYGYLEETYYTFSYSPVPNDEGGTGGIICANTDETRRIMGERQLALLHELTAATAEARTVSDACRRSAAALAGNPRDLPFALVYLVEPEKRGVALAGACGIEPGHPAAPPAAPLDGSPWPFAEALRANKPILVDTARGFGDLPRGAWDRPPVMAAVLPIAHTGETGRSGVMVAGLNPYRLFDAGYQGLLTLVSAQVAAGIGNAQAYEEERRRAEALAEVDRAKTAFFSNVSHEFRTPLTLMLGPLEEALSRVDRDGAVGPLVDTAHRNGLRLLKLVNSLLDFSRIEAGRVQARYQPTDLAAFTAELAASFRSAIDRAGLRLDLACATLPEPVHVDRDMWEKVVLNLLSNAFKFTFDGAIGVAVGASADGTAAELVVRDTGTGIPAHELPRLFERFHRVEGSKGRSFEGSGIGLALVQELVKLHGGTIRVASEPGRGSVFTVSIPFGSAHLPQDRIGAAPAVPATGLRARAYVEEALRWLPQPAAGEPGAREDTPSRSAADDLGAGDLPRAAGGRVLLADDNADMRDYVGRLLVEQGYVVEAVADGAAALAAARREKPDLVLSDVMMPGLDGVGLLRALRAEPPLREVPVVLLSARAGEEARIEGLDAGADDYLTKPFAARELLARVGANLQMARLRREAAEALRARTTELETVLATVPAAVWVTRDVRAKEIWANPQAAAMTRQAPGSQPSLTAPPGKRPQHFRMFRDGGEPPPYTQPIQRAARGQEVRGEEWELRFDDGSAVTILVHATPLRDGDGQVAGAVAAAVDITARKHAEAQLRALNRSLESQVAERTRERDRVWRNSRDLLAIIGADGVFRAASPSWTAVLGYAPEEVVGRSQLDFIWPDDAAASQAALDVATRDVLTNFENRFRHKDGAPRWISWMTAHEGDVVYAYGRHVTREKEQAEALRRAQEQLRQAQKMEAIGQLTGGVAHDFNNILHVIHGNLEMLQRFLATSPEGAPERFTRPIQSALRSVDRAAALTHRLLAFARRQPLSPEIVDANKLVGGMSDLLRRTLSEAIAIETVLAGGLWRTFADPNQLENALLNLAVNARDAMPQGGKLTIETANTHLDELYAASHEEVTPGQYVMIAVTDTATGMSRESAERAFEPFFTTKDVGKGTGLGLSQVYGFVKQSGGHAKLYSEPGEGTTVRIYLPRQLRDSDLAQKDAAAPPELPGAEDGETILVIEDDDDVRANSVQNLRELGYRVLEAADGPAALRVLETDPSVRLLFTDVGLPGGMTGRQVADEARRRRPELSVLFTTGYARNAIVHHGRLDPGVELIVKPYTYAALAAKIRAALAK